MEVGGDQGGKLGFILITYSEKSSGVLETGVGGSVIQSDLWCKGSFRLLCREQATGKEEFPIGSPASSLLE